MSVNLSIAPLISVSFARMYVSSSLKQIPVLIFVESALLGHKLFVVTLSFLWRLFFSPSVHILKLLYSPQTTPII